MAAQIQITNQASFLASVREAQNRVSDLSEPLNQIGLDWMRTNALLFQQAGAGVWPDLSGGRSGRDAKGRFRSPNSGYKAQKLKKWGFVYPMLVASGKLERSMTQPGDPNSLFEVINGTTLMLGTRAMSEKGANYPAFLNYGTRKMPARPFLNIPQISVQRWVKILGDYVATQADQAGKTGT